MSEYIITVAENVRVYNTYSINTDKLEPRELAALEALAEVGDIDNDETADFRILGDIVSRLPYSQYENVVDVADDPQTNFMLDEKIDD